MNVGGHDIDSAWLYHLDGGRIWYYDVKGVRTRSLEAGESGPALILLHGTGAHAESFLKNVVPLAKRGYRTFAIDMLGCGMTDKPIIENGYNIGHYSRHVLDFIETLGLTRVTVLGESLGGWVAMHAALHGGGSIERVINVTGGGLRFGDPTPEETRGWSDVLQRGLAAIDSGTWETWRSRMNWLVVDPSSMPDEMVAIRGVIFARPEMREAARRLYYLLENRISGNAEAEDFSLTESVLAKVDFPVFYIWTEHNPSTPKRVAEHAASVTPNSEIVVMKDCAHWPQWESADEFNDLVGGFMR